MARTSRNTLLLTFSILLATVIVVEAVRLEIIMFPRSTAPISARLVCLGREEILQEAQYPGNKKSMWFRLVSFELPSFSPDGHCGVALNVQRVLHVGRNDYYIKVLPLDAEVDLAQDNVDSGFIGNQQRLIEKNKDGLTVDLSVVPDVSYPRRFDVLVATSVSEWWQVIWDTIICGKERGY